MPGLSTYGELKTSIVSELERANLASFVAEIPRFILLAEQRIFRGAGTPYASPPVRVRDMEAVSATLAATTGSATLPTDFLEVRTLFSSTGTKIVMQSTETFFGLRSAVTTGTPVTYTLEGNTIVLSPTIASGTVALRYYKKYASLSADGDTNWLLANAPSIYFWSAVFEAYLYVRDQTKAADALQNYVAGVAGLNDSEMRAKYAGSAVMPQPSTLPMPGEMAANRNGG